MQTTKTEMEPPSETAVGKPTVGYCRTHGAVQPTVKSGRLFCPFCNKILSKRIPEGGEGFEALESPLIKDFRTQAEVARSAAAFSRWAQQLRQLNPELYGALYGGTSRESKASDLLIAISVAQLVRSMAEAEEEKIKLLRGQNQVDPAFRRLESLEARLEALSRPPPPGGEADKIKELEAQVQSLREELHKKEIESLKGEIEVLKKLWKN
jgi:hypothetical protein